MRYCKLYSAFLCLPFMALCSQSSAQTTLPYFTGFDSDAQKTGWQKFKKGAAVQTNEWQYAAMGAFSAPNCLQHNYPVGGTEATKNWFVSPAFNFAPGAKIDSLRYAFSGFGVPAAGDTVAVYLLKGNADPALATSRTLLYDFRGNNYANDNVWRNLTSINIPATTGSCYIAIYYRTVNNWLDVRFDNLKVRSLGSTSIGNTAQQAEDVVLYPNPAKDLLQVKTQKRFTQTYIYDLNGKVVYQEAFRTSIPVAKLPPGNYIIACTTSAGVQWKGSFVRQ